MLWAGPSLASTRRQRAGTAWGVHDLGTGSRCQKRGYLEMFGTLRAILRPSVPSGWCWSLERRASPWRGPWRCRRVPFEDTPTPPEGRWNSEGQSTRQEQHMTSAASDQIYCFKCKGRADTLEAQEVVLKNGRPAVTGRCAASPAGGRGSAWARTGSNRWRVKRLCGTVVDSNQGGLVTYQGWLSWPLERAGPPPVMAISSPWSGV